jgi:hypothetical protein
MVKTCQGLIATVALAWPDGPVRKTTGWTMVPRAQSDFGKVANHLPVVDAYLAASASLGRGRMPTVSRRIFI